MDTEPITEAPLIADKHVPSSQSADAMRRAAFALRMLRTAVADAKRPIDKRLARAELRVACAMMGVMDRDNLAGHYYVGAVERAWETHDPARPVGGARGFTEWADAIDEDLAGRLTRLASGDTAARF